MRLTRAVWCVSGVNVGLSSLINCALRILHYANAGRRMSDVLFAFVKLKKIQPQAEKTKQQ